MEPTSELPQERLVLVWIRSQSEALLLELPVPLHFEGARVRYLEELGEVAQRKLDASEGSRACGSRSGGGVNFNKLHGLGECSFCDLQHAAFQAAVCRHQECRVDDIGRLVCKVCSAILQSCSIAAGNAPGAAGNAPGQRAKCTCPDLFSGHHVGCPYVEGKTNV